MRNRTGAMGHAPEVLSGQPFDEFVRERIGQWLDVIPAARLSVPR